MLNGFYSEKEINLKKKRGSSREGHDMGGLRGV